MYFSFQEIGLHERPFLYCGSELVSTEQSNCENKLLLIYSSSHKQKRVIETVGCHQSYFRNSRPAKIGAEGAVCLLKVIAFTIFFCETESCSLCNLLVKPQTKMP